MAALLRLVGIVCAALLAATAGFASPTDNVALVVSAAAHHYETAAFFCYHLQRLQMDLHVWLHHHAARTYGDVSQSVFASYTDKVRLFRADMRPYVPNKIKLLVYVTMNTRREVKGLCPMNRLHEELYDRAESVIMVNHHMGGIKNVLTYCRPPKCTAFHLGTHVERAVHEYLYNRSISNYQLAAAVPVYEPPLAEHLAPHVEKAMASFTKRTRVIAVQGTMVSYRRNYDALFQCFEDIRQDGVDARLLLMGSQAHKTVIPAALEPYTTVLGSASHPMFYAAVAKADVVAMFANPDMHYESERSSSTVPTAVLASVPVVLPTYLLPIYPCLAASPTYQRIVRDGDCDSLKAAMSLTDDELAELKGETRRCRQLWLQEGQLLLRRLIDQPFNGSARQFKQAAKASKGCCKCTKDILTLDRVVAPFPISE